MLTPLNQPSSKEVPVYNPDSDDFEITYDINEDKQPKSYILRSREIDYFPPVIADHIKKHLADRLLNKRGVKTNHSDEHDQIIKEELSVEL